MNNNLPIKLAIPFLALAIVAGGVCVLTFTHTGTTVANAQSLPPQATQQQSAVPDKPETTADTADTTGGSNKKDPSYTSSIRVTESAQEQNDVTEAQQLASLAKISQAQAKAAAEKSVGGTATNATLESENGNIVYVVTIGSQEVKVDAGNGAILHTETADTSAETGKAETN